MPTVLVADDEFAVLEVLAMVLEGEGHRVLKAGDGADAWRLLASQPCDVVICDDTMPLMSGPQLVAAMRAEPRLARVPVILMLDMFAPAHAADPGVMALRKPVRLAALRAVVAAALATVR